MSRELSSQQAFQVQCLTQMGVGVWLDASQGVSGTAFFDPLPWPMVNGKDVSVTPAAAVLGFSQAEPQPPIQKLAPEEKDQTVASLREQLNAGPEIVVEDLQPIEELAVNIEVEPEPERVYENGPASLDIRAYLLTDQLLIITDVPRAFQDDDEIEKLALKMGRALLQQPAQEWQSRRLTWPGALTNPHFIVRQDWLLGAVEGFVEQLLKLMSGTPKVVLAGSNIAELLSVDGIDVMLSSCTVARISSLPELYRIPELRKEAWSTMQKGLFSAPASDA
ncbi:hypothetical protein [Marinomonas sp.]